MNQSMSVTGYNGQCWMSRPFPGFESPLHRKRSGPSQASEPGTSNMRGQARLPGSSYPENTRVFRFPCGTAGPGYPGTRDLQGQGCRLPAPQRGSEARSRTAAVPPPKRSPPHPRNLAVHRSPRHRPPSLPRGKGRNCSPQRASASSGGYPPAPVRSPSPAHRTPNCYLSRCVFLNGPHLTEALQVDP